MKTGMSQIASCKFSQRHAALRKNIHLDLLFRESCHSILEHLKYKLEVPAYEWRRILKVKYTKFKYLSVTYCNGVSPQKWKHANPIRSEK